MSFVYPKRPTAISRSEAQYIERFTKTWHIIADTAQSLNSSDYPATRQNCLCWQRLFVFILFGGDMTEEVGAGSRRLAAESDYSLIGISECTLSNRWGAWILKPHQISSQQTDWKTWGFKILEMCMFGEIFYCIEFGLQMCPLHWV